MSSTPIMVPAAAMMGDRSVVHRSLTFGQFPESPGGRVNEFWRMLARRKWLIVLMLVALNVLAAVVIGRLPPRYTATASVMIGQREEQVVDLKAVIAGLSGASDVIEDEIQMLRSRRVARTVVEDLDLERDPAFNPALAPPGALARARRWMDGTLATLLQRLPAPMRSLLPRVVPDVATASSVAADPLAVPIDNFLQHLSVSPVGHSRVISVAFESANPVLSAKAANAVADAYINDQLKSKLDATEHAHQWLSERVAEMRNQVISADQAVESYRRSINLTQGRTAPLLAEQISELSDRLVQAKVDEATAESRLVASSAMSTDGLPEVQGSAVMQGLRSQQSEMLAQATELARTHGDRYPRLAALRAGIAEIDGRIRRETGSIAGELRADSHAAADRVALLQKRLDVLRAQDNVGSEGEIQLRMLQHDADADRALYDRLLARAKETNVESGLQQADAAIVSHAEPPTGPSFPKPGIMLPIFFVASVLVAGLIVAALEALSRGFAHPDQVEQLLGIPALGAVPFLRRGLFVSRDPATDVLARPDSAYSEALRSLQTTLALSAGTPPKVLLITSPMPGEGKSSVVLALARLMASCGKRVAVIDCDMRRPALHAGFGVPRTPGLLDCLAGDHAPEEVMRSDKWSAARLMPIGTRRRISPVMLGSDEMRNLLVRLGSCYDVVLLDSAPMLAVSDTRNLCALADRVVVLARWNDTRRSAVIAALRQIMAAGGTVAGVLLSMVDLQRSAQYGQSHLYRRRIGLELAD